MIKGYKVFKPDWTCRNKQYTCPGKFEENVKLSCCIRGMHFCERLIDCFNYYSFDPKNKVAEVIAYGEIAKEGDKSCTNKLEIVREITWEEVLEKVNIGYGNTGYGNTGDYNAGSCNIGSYNAGSFNIGDWNTGDWNISSKNTGCFMTEEQKITMFNKLSDWTYQNWIESDACWLLNRMPKKVNWILKLDMTDEEKTQNPSCEITGGYLETTANNNTRQEWWNGLKEKDKLIIKSLPNFDAEIFKQCTGIDVNK